MKKHLRLLAWLLSLTMLCELLPFAAFAQSDVGEVAAATLATLLEETNSTESTGKCGDNLTYTLSADGVLTISGTGAMYDYNATPPYNISPWFQNLNIARVILNDGVSSIGTSAFRGCYKITSVSLPNSLTSIGYDAFDGCSDITNITLPQNLSKIGGYAFASVNFTSIEIPDSVTSIEQYTFANCKKLEQITLSSNTLSIGEGAFNSCSSLTAIELPESVTNIDRFAFWNCSSLDNVTLPSEITTINENSFLNCTSLSTISIPASVTSIGSSAFYGCSTLKDVYFSGSQSQWNSITIDAYQNDSLKYAVIHCQDSEEKHFTFERDNPSFLNQAKYFFQGSELNYWNQKYNSGRPISFTDRFFHHFNQYASVHLSQEKYNQLTKNLSPAALQWFNLKMRSGNLWGGSCYGMVLVSAIHYMDPDRLSYAQLASTGLDADSATYSLPAPVDNSNVEDLINYYYASQLLPTQYKILSNCLYNCANDYDRVLNEIVTSLSHGIPVIASLSNHEIMLLNVKAELNDHYVLGIYDPNEATEQTLLLYKSPYIDADGDGYLNINYKNKQTQLQSYTLGSDLDYIDVRNYFDPSIDHETATDYNDAHITIRAGGSANVVHGDQYYYRTENGKLIEKSSAVHLFYPSNTSDENPSNDAVDLIFPKPSVSEDVKLELSSDGVNDASMILNNSTLAVSASGPVNLVYNEQSQKLDVTASNPTDISLMLTQNDTSEAWPWHSWAVDTTDTTTLHAELDSDGLHLSGDGLTNAEYATKNVTDDTVDSGTISVQPDDTTGLVEVTIVNKKEDASDNNKTEIVTPTKPTPDPDPTPTPTPDPEEPDPKPNPEPTPTPEPEPKPTPTPSNPTNPANPAAPTSSSGGGGGGGAALVLGVGAVALTAGLMMAAPVEVQGTVVLADNTALPNAKISLLQNGAVVMQTTADESGAFVLKVKRGNYELTAAYTDADGQLVHKTTSIKAPAKDLVITF